MSTKIFCSTRRYGWAVEISTAHGSTVYTTGAGQPMYQIRAGFSRDLRNPAALQGNVIWAAGLHVK